MNRYRELAVVFTLGCASLLAWGCSVDNHTTAKQEALDRWEGVRANVAVNLAEQQFESGQLDKARQTLSRAVEGHPDNAQIHLLLAKVLFEQQDLASAQAHIQQAGKGAPDWAEVDYMRGVFAQAVSQGLAAHSAYLAAYQKDRESQRYLSSLAEAKSAIGQSRRAAELLQSRFDDFPSSANLRIAAANCYMILEDFGQAELYYHQAIDIDPSNTEAKEALSNMLCLAGKYSEAATLLAELIDSSSPDHENLQQRLADCYTASGEYSAAIRAYEKCLREKPAQPEVQVSLARARLLAGQTHRARLELEELAGREPGNSEVWELLGHVCMHEKRYDLAGRAYSRAMQTGTKTGELQNLIEICSLEMQSPDQPTLESPAVSSVGSPGEDQIYPGDD